MRTSVVSVLAAFSVCACADQRLYIDGTVSYTASPALEGAPGALPLRALYCLQSVHLPSDTEEGVRLGAHCILNRRPNEGLKPIGKCLVPTANGEVPLVVQSASLDSGWRSSGKTGGFVAPLDVVLGGTTQDGHYLTYRFTGTRGDEEATPETCASVLARPDS